MGEQLLEPRRAAGMPPCETAAAVETMADCAAGIVPDDSRYALYAWCAELILVALAVSQVADLEGNAVSLLFGSCGARGKARSTAS